MSYEVTLPLSLILIAISLFNIFYAHKKYRNNLVTILSIWLFIYVLYVFFVPSVYGVFTGFESSISYGINPDHLVLVYFLEIIFILILLLTFYNAPSRNFSRSVGKIIPNLNRKSEVYFLLFLSVIVMILYIDDLLPGLASYGRIQQYDSDVGNITAGFLNLPITITAPLKAIFVVPGKIAAALLVTMPYSKDMNMSKFKFNFFKLVALLFLGFVAVYGIAVGVRHITLGVFIIIAVAGFIQGRYKFTYYFVFGLIAIIAIGPVIGSVYRTFLTQSSSQDLGIIERISSLSEFSTSNNESAMEKLWDEFGVRLVDARLSSGLIKFSDREGHVGPSVLLNTLYSPIPRYLCKDKPAPRSYDGNHRGLAGFVVWNELTGREWGNWGGYTAASHSWWEFSLVGVIINALLYGLFLRVTIESTRMHQFIGSLIFLYSINIMHFDSFFMKTMPDMLMFLLSRLFPLLIIVFLWAKASRLKFRM